MIVWLKTYAGDHAHAACMPKSAASNLTMANWPCLCGERVEAARPAPDHKRCPTCERKARKLEQAHGVQVAKALVEAVTGKKAKRIGTSMMKSEKR